MSRWSCGCFNTFFIKAEHILAVRLQDFLVVSFWKGGLRSLRIGGVTLVSKWDIENFEAKSSGRPRQH